MLQQNIHFVGFALKFPKISVRELPYALENTLECLIEENDIYSWKITGRMHNLLDSMSTWKVKVLMRLYSIIEGCTILKEEEGTTGFQEKVTLAGSPRPKKSTYMG